MVQYLLLMGHQPVLYKTVSGDCRGFKALKQIVKIHFKLGNHKEMLEAYK